MAVHASLIPVSMLSLALYKSEDRIESQDAYANLMIAQASNNVRAAARQPGWVRLSEDSVVGPGQTVAPSDAADVTLWVAMRAYTNPRNLERRTAGPISETFRDTGVYGMELTEDEKARLALLSPTGGGGIWVQPIDFGEEATPVLVPSMSSMGITDLGDTYLGTTDQWPWNIGQEP